LWIFVAAIISTHIFFLWRVRDRIARGDPDFTVFYTAGKMLREGQGPQLYHPNAQLATQAEFARNSDIRRGPLPYIHPPFEALFFLPLTFLSYPQAFVAWNLINLAILFGVAGLLKNSLLSLQSIPVWHMVLFGLAFFPVFANFHQGQDAILLLLVLTLSFRALDRDADLLAGCWLGLGLFKYHLILPLALVLMIWRGRRFILGFAASSSAVVLISLGLVGWKGVLEYPAYAWRVVSQPAFGGIPPGQLPSLFGLVGGWPFAQKIGSAVPVVVVAGSAALLMIVASLRKYARVEALFRLCFAGAVMTALLVGWSTNSYDLSLLVVPLAVIMNCGFERPLDRKSLIAPAVPLLISPLWFFLWMRWQRINLMALFLLCWLFVLIAEVRRLRRLKGEPLPRPLVANA
jgi:Glycosyltransferase family 87